MFVEHRFKLAHNPIIDLKPKFGFNGFGELVFYRTYSRIKKDGGQETWNDVCLRVTEGTFSIRKDFYLKNHIGWEESYWQAYASKFIESMFHMKWMPPGRGLWAMGSDFVYERGSMALYNCALTDLRSGEKFAEDIAWLMDSLMCGVGVGFSPLRDNLEFQWPTGDDYTYIIPDSREGWTEAVKLLLLCYINGTSHPIFNFSLIREAGLPIKGFGGISSGPEPLINLLDEIDYECIKFYNKKLDVVELKTNISNMVGSAVIAGNVRRSAQIACGSIHDEVFMNLKNYDLYPHREKYGWMSNNSVVLETAEDFDKLGEIAKRVVRNGEPGVINKKNIKYGRIGKYEDAAKFDVANGTNPCGEILLEGAEGETCNLSETLPTVCDTVEEWLQACEFATFYCSTVTLLPTHQSRTNRVVARNRRIGVGIIDYTGWKHEHGVHKITKWLRQGYKVVCDTNRRLAAEAGIPESIRKTTIKPGGTTPKLAGKTSGCGHPTFTYTLRRIRIAQNSPVHNLLVKANIPYEADLHSANTDVFEYPILQGPAKPATEISLWEQAMNVVLLQREWADNAVSNTLYFKPMWTLIKVGSHELLSEYLGTGTASWILLKEIKSYVVPGIVKVTIKNKEVKIYEYNSLHEENDIEAVLSSIVPLIKSVSLLPHSDVGVYAQSPEEGITKEEYNRRLNEIIPIDWSKFGGSDGQDERYCQGDSCERIQ